MYQTFLSGVLYIEIIISKVDHNFWILNSEADSSSAHDNPLQNLLIEKTHFLWTFMYILFL